MNKLYIFLLFLLLCVNVLYAGTKLPSQQEKEGWYSKSLLDIPDVSRFTEDDVIELIENTIPEKYINAFIIYTGLDPDIDPNILRIFLLGIGKHESHWIATRSHKANSNGSYDRGYLMLNDGNIQNKRFMSMFGPVEVCPAQDDIELYLIACIRYFTYLFKRYGYENGVYIYNSGEPRYIKDTMPLSTYWYKYRVKTYVSEYIETLYEIADNNRLARELEEKRQVIEDQKNSYQFIPLHTQIEKDNNKYIKFIQYNYYISNKKRKALI